MLCDKLPGFRAQVDKQLQDSNVISLTDADEVFETLFSVPLEELAPPTTPKVIVLDVPVREIVGRAAEGEELRGRADRFRDRPGAAVRAGRDVPDEFRAHLSGRRAVARVFGRGCDDLRRTRTVADGAGGTHSDGGQRRIR